jgi:hypothetical protein
MVHTPTPVTMSNMRKSKMTREMVESMVSYVQNFGYTVVFIDADIVCLKDPRQFDRVDIDNHLTDRRLFWAVQNTISCIMEETEYYY